MKSFFYAVALLLLIFCNGLYATSLPLVEIITATNESCADVIVPKDVVLTSPPVWKNLPDLPKFCQIIGQIEGNTLFELRLPKQWNGRFLMAGCGGFCGSLLPDKKGHSNSINEALKNGFAAISHNGGHQGASSKTQWAFNNPELLTLFAHKILPQVTKIGVAITESLYHKAPHHRYFSGCSNGGRLGMMAAQRYPHLFDGIAAGSSIFDLSGNAGLWGNWLVEQTQPKDKPLFDRNKTAFLKKIVLKQCDSLDGEQDGVIADPQACKVDFNQYQCSSAESLPHCFSAKEVNIIKNLYAGVKNSNDEIVYSGMEYGSEHYADFWLFGSEKNPAWGVLASQGYRDLLAHDITGKVNSEHLSTDKILKWNALSKLPSELDAVNTDLSNLIKNDTKLFIYHGLSDPLILPQPMIDYYQQAIVQNNGYDALQKNARLFMVPALGHCWEKPVNAPVAFDPLSVVVNWVETGKAPNAIVTQQRDKSSTVVKEKSICAYPKTAIVTDANHTEKQKCQ